MKVLVKSRRGMAIPIVLLFCFCTLIYAGTVIYLRKEVKQENVINVNFLQANFLAQSAVQHALLKFRLLPQEAYDAGVVQQGFCPFWGIQPGTETTGPNKTGVAMDIFRSDCNTTWKSWDSSLTGISNAEWKYEIASLQVISAFTDASAREMVQTVQITAVGSVRDDRGGRGWRHEEMKKTIEIRRKF